MAHFQPISTIVARWEAWEGPAGSLEHLDIRQVADGIVASGTVTFADISTPAELRYRLRLDGDWRLRDARLQTSQGRSLHLESDGEGRWQQDGAAAPLLDGCIDIDIEATPFTNTLPIRRLALKTGESTLVRLSYVHVPSLSVRVGNQRYTAIEPGALYRFESLDDAFVADLTVDPDGLVVDYSGLFRRLP